jgi:hypothetical protein
MFMNRQKWFQWGGISLLIVNTALMIGILIDHPGPQKQGSPKEEIISLLHLDDEQIVIFENLVQEHQWKMRTLMDEMMSAQQRYYKSCFERNDSLVMDSKPSLSQAHQAWEDMQVQHLRDIESICRADQLKYFHQLVERFPQFFQPPHPPLP